MHASQIQGCVVEQRVEKKRKIAESVRVHNVVTVRTDKVAGHCAIGAVSGNEIIKINLLLHAFPVVTAKQRNVISIAFRHRSVHDGHNCRGTTTTGQWS